MFASPLARKIAADRNINLAALTGTGPNSRIIAADVHEAQQQAPALQQAPSAQAHVQASAAAAQAQAPAASAAAGDYTDGKLTNVRKVRAPATSPV